MTPTDKKLGMRKRPQESQPNEVNTKLTEASLAKLNRRRRKAKLDVKRIGK